jgi:MFS family permease
VAARSLRGFADGLVSVVLAAHLTALGLSAGEIGAVATATLLGSAALTLAVGLGAGRVPPRRVLLAACALMAATGLGFAGLSSFAALLVLAFVGTLNPSSGDVSVFLPTEQAWLAGSVAAERRTALFARYNLLGALFGALGALASGVPEWVSVRLGVGAGAALRACFLAYAALALAQALLYLRLPGAAPPPPGPQAARRAPLVRSRRVVLELTALFGLDSFGGGFVVQSLLALWLLRRFELSLAEAGTFFFATGLASAVSQMASPWLAARIGLVRTMVYTHLPANALLVAAAFMPTAGAALACLLARMLFSQLDVPARQALVMGLVPPEERAAAAGLTNVPRSLASALSPLLAGLLLERTSFGWPLVAGGLLKILYDGLLLWRFRSLEPQKV